MRGLAYDVYDSRRLIVAAGLAAAVLAAVAGSSVFDAARPFGFQDPASESSRGYELLEDATGEQATPGVVLLVEPGVGVDSDEGRREVHKTATALSEVDGIVRVIQPKPGGGWSRPMATPRSCLVSSGRRSRTLPTSAVR